ncbi:adenosylcobinamide-phosphate synthase CbiB [Paratissierella segnis]|jgi:adenosylcobinamide-phosphate synthase|uniref:Cobalamin biosynthesis protein CobD n=1 Tax=Paratissierella segnis TaxID=2763679 RepID=A0A926EVU6_9FIRM|nr:adenosylcobinamide-phosphate synthase CbiB [Paratissierella segnis]MBC8589460.1 cobalamin biosynthesis protein CobD [Paratissierella segnis]
MTNLIIAVIIDFLIGDPYSFPHPVKLMGKIIELEEKFIRKYFKSKKKLKIAGLFIVIINISLGFFPIHLILNIIKTNKILYNLVSIYLIYTCIAAKNLMDEANKVLKKLDISVEKARVQLSYIVGRDTQNLNRDEIIKATIETVAENTSDGVIAPYFYIMLFGVPGGFVYKFVNTMDSMLGYKNDKYMDLGFFPAKADDLFNLIPSRLTAVLMNISSLGRFNTKKGFKILIRDRRNHKSPNSGYPESAVAGLLGIQLGGSSYYHGVLVEKPTIGDKDVDIDKTHISNTIEIMYRTLIAFLLLYFLLLYIFLNYVSI